MRGGRLDGSLDDMADTSSRSIATYVLAAALFALAGAMVYFSITLKAVSDALPPVVEGIEGVVAELDPTLDRVDIVLEETVPTLLEEIAAVRAQIEDVQQEIPVILAEAAAYREMIPSVLAEIEQVRGTIPDILQRVDNIQAQLPDVLAEVEAVRGEVPGIVEQVEGIQTQIPAILAEIEAVRTSIPGYLAEANALVEKARAAGKEASEGAVTGFMTGIIKAPVSLVTGIGGKSIGGVEISDTDRAQIRTQVQGLLANPKAGATAQWKNSSKNLSITLTVVEIRGEEGSREIPVKLEAFRRRREVEEFFIVAEEQPDGSWESQRFIELPPAEQSGE